MYNLTNQPTQKPARLIGPLGSTINKEKEERMKKNIISLLVLFITILSGCTTPINNLLLPPVTTIEGHITKVNDGGFVIKDNSGEIYVAAKLPGSKVNVSTGDVVKVYGNLRSGMDKIFDSYVIKKQSGEQIIIDNPPPLILFVIQSSFKE